jgi:hypothetical protein
VSDPTTKAVHSHVPAIADLGRLSMVVPMYIAEVSPREIRGKPASSEYRFKQYPDPDCRFSSRPGRILHRLRHHHRLLDHFRHSLYPICLVFSSPLPPPDISRPPPRRFRPVPSLLSTLASLERQGRRGPGLALQITPGSPQ